MKEYRVVIRGNNGYLRGIWYFLTYAQANRYAATWKAKGWTDVTVEDVD